MGFAAAITPDAGISVSDESEDVRWFPIDELPAQVPAGFGARLERVRRTAMSLPPNCRNRTRLSRPGA